MDTGTILLILGLFYFTAQGLSLSFRFTKVPDVLILVFTGIIIGPLFKFVEITDFGRMGNVMTVIALAMILFEGGTSLNLSTMGKSLSSTLLITLITAAVTICIIAVGALPFLDGNWSLALLTGAILCGTSSAVVIPMVQSLKLGEKASTILVLESALTDVICIVLTFALVESIFTGDVSTIGISAQVVKSLGFAAILGILGGLFWLFVWNKVRKIPSSIFTTIAFAFILYGVAEVIGISGAISTLLFGITLTNLPVFFQRNDFPKISEVESKFYQEIVFLLKTFFFIYLGVSIKISDFGIVTVSLILIAILYFLRLFITKFFLSKTDINTRDAIVTSAMIPKGLAPAVLASLVVQKNIDNAETIQTIVFSVIIISIILTSVLVPLATDGPLKNIYGSILKKFNKEIES